MLHCAAQRQMVCRNIIALASAMPQCPCGVNSNIALSSVMLQCSCDVTGLQKYNCTEQRNCAHVVSIAISAERATHSAIKTQLDETAALETCQSFCNTFTLSITLQYFYFGHNCSALCHTFLCTCSLSPTQLKCWRSDL